MSDVGAQSFVAVPHTVMLYFFFSLGSFKCHSLLVYLGNKRLAFVMPCRGVPGAYSTGKIFLWSISIHSGMFSSWFLDLLESKKIYTCKLSPST